MAVPPVDRFGNRDEVFCSPQRFRVIFLRLCLLCHVSKIIDLQIRTCESVKATLQDLAINDHTPRDFVI